jgi:hypothetical protein
MLTGLAECHAVYEVCSLLICAVAAHSPVHCQGISGDAHGVLSLGVPDFGVSGKTSHEYYFVHFYFLSGALLHRGTAFFFLAAPFIIDTLCKCMSGRKIKNQLK